MKERFADIFEEVRQELNISWYALFESNKFNKVIRRIKDEFGPEIIEEDEFDEWMEEMAWNL